MYRVAYTFLLCTGSLICFADAQATVKVTSKRDPTKTWDCLVVVPGDDTTKPEYGSCMPEALCDSATQTSKWKNAFGYLPLTLSHSARSSVDQTTLTA